MEEQLSTDEASIIWDNSFGDLYEEGGRTLPPTGEPSLEGDTNIVGDSPEAIGRYEDETQYQGAQDAVSQATLTKLGIISESLVTWQKTGIYPTQANPLTGEAKAVDSQIDYDNKVKYDKLGKLIGHVKQNGVQPPAEAMDDFIAGTRKGAVALANKELFHNEGPSGDTATSVATGEKGLTTATFNAMKKKYGKDITQSEASKYYLGDVWDGLNKLKGFSGASEKLQVGLLDNGYNLGAGMSKYKGLTKALDNLDKGIGTEEDVMKTLLDTANIGGQSSKGIAANRRAKAYNRVADVKIDKVKQDADGRITYLAEDGSTVFTYKPKKGKHSSSKAGTVSV